MDTNFKNKIMKLSKKELLVELFWRLCVLIIWNTLPEKVRRIGIIKGR
jgi:hypothetical protein